MEEEKKRSDPLRIPFSSFLIVCLLLLGCVAMIVYGVIKIEGLQAEIVHLKEDVVIAYNAGREEGKGRTLEEVLIDQGIESVRVWYYSGKLEGNFHRETCSVKGSGRYHRYSVSDALAAGFTPCEKCILQNLPNW